MKKEEFLDLAPGYVGDILYEHLHLLQTDATTKAFSSPRTNTPESLSITKAPNSQTGQNNNLKLGSNVPNVQMTENNIQSMASGRSFQTEGSNMSPEHHVPPYSYPQVSPPSSTDGAAAAAAMTAAAQHHALYNYSNAVSGAYPQGNSTSASGYDSYHQFYAAAVAATAMAAARSYGEGQNSSYGYPQMSPTAGRDQQYSNSHHQHHSSLQYNPFSSSRGLSAQGGCTATLNRSLSSPTSQSYHSSFAVSFSMCLKTF